MTDAALESLADALALRLSVLSERQRERFLYRLRMLVKYPDLRADAPYNFWLGKEAA